MAKCLVGAAGGLAAADRAKLIPENIRAGVTLFEGTQREVAGKARAFCLFAQGRTNPSTTQAYCNAEATKYTNASGDISATDGSALLTINRSGRYRAQIGIAPYQFSGSSGARLLKNEEVIGSVFPVSQYDSGYFDFEAEQGDILTWQIYSWSDSAYAYCFMAIWQIE